VLCINGVVPVVSDPPDPRPEEFPNFEHILDLKSKKEEVARYPPLRVPAVSFVRGLMGLATLLSFLLLEEAGRKYVRYMP